MQIIQSRAGEGNTVGTMVRLPRELRDEIKIQAIRAGRSMNTHLVMILRAAAGGEFDGKTPAAGDENAAFERGVV